VRERSQAKIARALKPGQAVTMEFNAQRVSLVLDSRGIVSAVRCG